MSIYVGSNEITDIQIGSNAINSVYVGANKVWERVTSLDTQTVTVGNSSQKWGFSNGGPFIGWNGGSITDGSCDFKGGSAYKGIYHDTVNGTYLYLNGAQTNAGFTSMTVSSITGSSPTVTYYRTDATFTSSTLSSWRWYPASSNPFGTTTGETKLITFN